MSDGQGMYFILLLYIVSYLLLLMMIIDNNNLFSILALHHPIFHIRKCHHQQNLRTLMPVL